MINLKLDDSYGDSWLISINKLSKPDIIKTLKVLGEELNSVKRRIIKIGLRNCFQTEDDLGIAAYARSGILLETVALMKTYSTLDYIDSTIVEIFYRNIVGLRLMTKLNKMDTINEIERRLKISILPAESIYDMVLIFEDIFLEKAKK